MNSDAVLSACQFYRYTLSRTWDMSVPPLGWVTLNPSTVDASVDDPTIRRCIGFAKREGFGGIVVANLFAWRATKPTELLKAVDPFGPDNVSALEDLFRLHSTVVAAWGAKFAEVRKARNRAALTTLLSGVADHPKMIRAMANRHGSMLMCLGTAKDGSPRHPLYVKGDQQLEPWMLS